MATSELQQRLEGSRRTIGAREKAADVRRHVLKVFELRKGAALVRAETAVDVGLHHDDTLARRTELHEISALVQLSRQYARILIVRGETA